MNVSKEWWLDMEIYNTTVNGDVYFENDSVVKDCVIMGDVYINGNKNELHMCEFRSSINIGGSRNNIIGTTSAYLEEYIKKYVNKK